MPIANLFCKKNKLPTKNSEEMILELSEIIGINGKEICLNFINDFVQLGQQYTVLINLYLPTIWTETDIEKIQLGLLRVISKYFKIRENEVLIITSMVQSGHVIENGKILKW